MGYEDNDVHNKKESPVKNIKIKMETSQDKNSDLKKKMKNKDTHKVKYRDKDIRERTRISQSEDSDLMKESENEDVYKVKHRDKNIEKRKTMSQDKNNDLMEKSDNEDTHKVKYRNKHIRKKIKMSQNSDSDSVKELDKDAHQIKCKDKDIWSGIKISQNDSDSMEESENKHAHKVKGKNKNIRSKINISQDKNSDLTYVSENEDIGKRTKMSQDKNNKKDKYTDEASSIDEDVEEEYCVEATHLIHKVKHKGKDIQNEKKTSQDEGSNSMEVSENKDIHEVKYKGDNILSKEKVSWNEDSDSTEKSENESAEIKCKDKDIGSNVKISQDNNSMEESKNKNAYKVKLKRFKNKDIRNWIEVSQDNDNNLMKKSENVCGIKISQNKDSDLKKELKSEDTIEHEDIGNRMKALQEKNHDSKKFWESKYIHRVKNKSEDEGIEEYCSDATYLARQMASAESPCRIEILKLHNLNVQLRHTVPPQHKIETRAGSHMPTRKEIEEFEKIIPIKKGSYSFEEDNIIANNWKTFCKIHNWDVNKSKPFLQLRIGNLTYIRNTRERRKFVQFLSDGLPERTLYSVYHRFKNLYENNLQRRFKPEEDQMIINHLENNPSLEVKRKYADLAKVLRRTRHSIWRRYRILNKRRKKDEDD
ncbi:PREDICTED: GRIP and coiled-coil domain-containing protein PFC0235w-like [Trachymyrmex cornetzi]|uniref:GRIP and coiled-coil domain-containing protein PFC0235w-like n=1 Tax=Trachymyrmex cornetzi TaxID=471704 RepID=UPI00084F15A1|nr:PREDICTED: GRIP and coiled-coil domain-containing protein PFC0235w-like [Trachymyrmex cornetzi]